MTEDIDDPFLTIDEPPNCCASAGAPSTTIAAESRVHPTGAMAAGSSTDSAISWHGPSSAGLAIRKATRVPRHRLCTLALLGIGSLAILFPKADAPVLLWNASPSVPIGLYRLTSRPSQPAALAVIRLPEPLRILAETRGYLRKVALLIKPVAAGAGDTVCRHGPLVTINGRIVAHATTLDAGGRPLPAWSGCFKLRASDIFVLSPDLDSFDSRYMGPIDRAHVLGIAQLGECEADPIGHSSAPPAW